MSINTLSPDTTTGPVPTGAGLLPLHPKLLPLAAELETFYRELHRLLTEGEEGRYAIIHGGQIHGIWDTFRDAIQYGYEKFEDGRFLAQKIDPRLQEALAQYFGPLPAPEPI